MKKSKECCNSIDFDRDLVTTKRDIEALQKNRPTWPVGDMSRMDELSIPFEDVDPEILRRVFPDMPPFEL